MRNILASFLFLGGLLSAAPVNVTLANPGTPLGVGYGTQLGPATLTTNGVNTPAMCLDDFLPNFAGNQWQANETSVSSSSFANTYLGNNGVDVNGKFYSSSQAYTAEAYLFSLITQQNADQLDIQEAASAIMDPLADFNIRISNNVAAQNYLNTALQQTSFNASGYVIITDPNRICGEYMAANAPEPASLMLFGGGLCALGVARFARRKKAKQ